MMLNRNLNIIGAVFTIFVLVATVIILSERYSRLLEAYLAHLHEDLQDTVVLDTSKTPGGD